MVGRTNALSGERNRRLPGRVATSAPNTGRNLNYISPSADTPGATFAAEYVAAFLIQSPNGSPVLCRAVGVGHQVLPLITGDCDRLRSAVPNFRLTKRHEPGSQSRREGTDLSPVGSRPLVHEWDHGGVNVTNPGKLFTFEGNEDGHRC
jgi:hypothetical protein